MMVLHSWSLPPLKAHSKALPDASVFLPTRVVALGLVVCTCDENPYRALDCAELRQAPFVRFTRLLIALCIAATRCDHVLHRAALVPLR